MIRYFLIIILLISNVLSSQFDLGESELKKGNIQKALKHYRKAVTREDEDALFKLGVFYFKGKYVKKDLRKALDYFKKASSLGHEKAKYNLALIYSFKNTPFHNYRLAYNNFLDLAQNSHAKAQFQVGNFLAYGFVEKDYKIAVKWYEQSAANGFKLASCSLAYMHANGMGVFPNLGRARVLAQEGFDKNIPLCVKVYKNFNLHKYHEDKGFKFGFYK